MTDTQQTIILHFPPSHFPAIITRLTTYLVQQRYSFLQTCYEGGHVDFDICNQQHHPLIRLTIQPVDGAASSGERAAPTTLRPLTTDAEHLLQHLLQADFFSTLSAEP